MAVRQYKITFKNLKEGQVPCSSPTIKILGISDNVVQKCEFTGNSVIFSIYESAIEGLQGTCINFSVLCESCGKCESLDGKLCFCNNFTDCDPCQDCINGTCVNRCPDKICVNDRCVDCDDEHPCPNNQICVNGRCQCPPGLPYFDEVTKKCYGCETDEECGPCHICVDGNCEKLTCICDEDLDKCVECTQTTHCGPNEICKNNKCECAPGYIYDAVLDECVPEPPCTEDEDLDPCQICVDGEIQDIICPDPNEVCIDGDCVPIPCEGSCDDATECGPDCGCLDGECVDCESLTCEECAQAIGCKCVSGDCEKDDDPCAQYSCETNCGERPDCECQDDGSCEEKECEGESTLVKNDCTLVYELETSECCECSDITLDNKLVSAQISNNLNKLLITSRVEVRKGSVSSPFGIVDIHRVDEDQYDDIMDNEEPTQGQVQVTAKYKYEGLTGGVGNGSITYETITLSPIFDVAGTGFSQQQIQVNIPGREYPSESRVLREVTLTYTLISELTFESGCTYNEGAVIGTYTFTDFQSETQIAADINKDTPGEDTNAALWIAKTLESEACRNPEARWYKAPALTGGSIGTFETVPFRKIYLNKVTPNIYDDYINQPDENDGPVDNRGELFSGYFYKVVTDCACQNEATAYYESTCEDPGRLVFCDPETADITFDECGKKFTFDSAFVTDCLPNYDYYGDNEEFVPDNAKLRYSIHVNGSATALSGSIRIADINGLIYNAGQEFTATELIEYIEIKFSHDNCDECTIRIDSDVDKDLPDYIVICEPSGSSNTTFIITFTNWTGITSVTVSGNVATPGSPTVNVTVPNTTTSLTGSVQFTGCPGTVPMSINLPENCCDDLEVTLTQSVTDCEGDEYNFTAIASPSIPGTFSFSVDGVFQTSNATGLFSTPKNLGGDEPDIVSVNFDPTASGCENVITSVEVDKTNAIVINSDQEDTIIECGSSTVFITYTTTGYTGTVTYTVTGDGTTVENLNGSEDLVIEVSGVPSDTKLVTITDVSLEDDSGNDCVTLNPSVTSIQWVDEPEVTSIDLSEVEVCEGEAITFTVLGTNGATATVNITNVLGTAPTQVIVGDPYVIYAGSSSNDVTITATLVTVGECSAVVNVGASVNVLDAPEITDVSYECETPGSPSSNIIVTVNATASSTVTIAADEGNVATTESPAGVYTGTIDPSNGGDSVTINITKAGCEDSEVIDIVACACDEEAAVDVEVSSVVVTEYDDCVGEEVTFDAVPSGGNAPYSYEWRLNNRISGTLLGTSSSLVHEILPGSYTIWVTVTDDEDCIFYTSVSIVGHLIPTASINGDATPCEGEATVYSVSFTNGPISTYQWYLDAAPTVATSTYSYTPVDTDPHDISVIITNSNGCVSAEATLEVTAEDCCVICETTEAIAKEGISFNRMRDVDSNVYTISPAVEFECVDPGDPSAANDDAAADLQTFLENLPAQCGTPVVSWESVNTGDSTECLSETFDMTVGSTGIWFRGITVNGTDYFTNTKIVNASGGVATAYTISQAAAETQIEGFINFALNQEGIGAISINCALPAMVSGGTVEVSVEIIGIAGDTVSFLYAGTSLGTPTSVDVNDAVCIGLLGTFAGAGCIKITVEDSSIVPQTLYNNVDGDASNEAVFIGPCNPV